MIPKTLRCLTPCQSLTLLAIALTSGCASMPEQSGFISDYSRLEKVGEAEMRFIAPKLREYEAYIVDPVQIRTHRDPPILKPKERAEVANYMKEAVEKILIKRDYQLANEAGVGVARIRVAVTDIQKSTWWLNLHWATKLSGVGTGGASIEGEIIDSVTGKQLAAWVRAGRGNQFELDMFSSLDDAKDVIDEWAKDAGKRLDELRAAKGY